MDCLSLVLPLLEFGRQYLEVNSKALQDILDYQIICFPCAQLEHLGTTKMCSMTYSPFHGFQGQVIWSHPFLVAFPFSSQT